MSLNSKSKKSKQKFEVTYISLEPLDDTSIKKKLAYPIKHQEFAYYTTKILDQAPKKIPENIIRYLVVKMPAGTEQCPVSTAKTKSKTQKIKIEELDKKLDEILKE